jgi:mannosyltransferase
VLETARRDRTVAVTVLLHLPLTLGLLLAASMRIWPRFFFADMGFVVLFLVQGVYACSAFAAPRLRALGLGAITTRGLFAGAAAVLLVASSVHAARNYRHPKQDFAGALAFIEAERAPGDAVVTLGLAAMPYARYFETGWPAVESAGELAAVQARAPRTWLVLAFPTRTARRYPDVMEVLAREFTLAKELPGTLGDGEVRVFVAGRGGTRANVAPGESGRLTVR